MPAPGLRWIKEYREETRYGERMNKMKLREVTVKPHVLMVELHSPGNRYVLELVREMKKLCDLTVFCNRLNTFDEPGIRWVRRFYDGGKGKVGAILAYGRTLADLRHIIVHGHYDVLHIQSFKLAAAEMKLYEQTRNCYRKLVMTVHNVLPHEPTEQDRRLYGHFYDICDLLIVHNEASRDVLERDFHIDRSKISVIPRGLYDTYTLKDNVRDSDPRRHFMYFGKLRPYKGVDILLKAISLLDEQSRAQCCFIIRGQQYPKLDQTDYKGLIREYGIESCVSFSNERVPEEEIPDLMGNADAMIFPYRKIYGSGVLLMAYTYKIPVIASDLPTFVEGTDDGKTGLLFRSEDAQDLARVLRQALIWDDEQIKRYREEISRISAERHSWRVTASRTIGAFRAMLNYGSFEESIAGIEQLLEEAAESQFKRFQRIGHAVPGNNGPYHCRETPVRNTGHWLVTYTYLWKRSGREDYRMLCMQFADYLLSEQAKSRSGAIQCVDDPKALDPINGLIGQAWTIEALLYAYEAYGKQEFYDCALRIFRSQVYDPGTGFWKRTAPDGEVIDFDYTINHQVWFCLAGLKLLRVQENECIRKQTDRFLHLVEREYFGIHRNGLIKHFGAMHMSCGQFRKLYFKQYVKYAGLKLHIFNPEKVCLLRQEEGYHLFELYGFAHIALQMPDYALFGSEPFHKALRYGTNISALNRILGTDDPATMNQFAYGYNSPAFEEPFVESVFSGRITVDKVRALLELQKRLTWNCETRMLDHNTHDPDTLTARLYEYVWLCELFRGV